MKNETTNNMSNYSIPPQVRIGHIHLKVSDLERSLNMFTRALDVEDLLREADNETEG